MRGKSNRNSIFFLNYFSARYSTVYRCSYISAVFINNILHCINDCFLSSLNHADVVYHSYDNYYYKAIRQNAKRKNKTYSKSPQNSPFLIFLFNLSLAKAKKYSASFLVCNVLRKPSTVGLCILYFDANIQYLAFRLGF